MGAAKRQSANSLSSTRPPPAGGGHGQGSRSISTRDADSQHILTRKVRSGSVAHCALEIIANLNQQWLPRIYIDQILPSRTRAYHLAIANRFHRVAIQETLLGVELKVGRRRMLCPDRASARYLAVFATIGSQDVAIPYDITRIAEISNKLEAAWRAMELLINKRTAGRSVAFHSRLRATLIGRIRREIQEAGAGKALPEFNLNTRQRLRSRKQGR